MHIHTRAWFFFVVIIPTYRCLGILHVCVNECFHVCWLASIYTCTCTCLFLYVCRKLRTHSHKFKMFFVEKKSHHQFTLGFRRHERNTLRRRVGGSLLKHLVGLMLEGEVNGIGQSRCNLTKAVLVLSWLMGLELTRQMRWLGYRLLLLACTSPLGISIFRRHNVNTLHCAEVHRPSSKGTKLLLQVIKAIINQRCTDTPGWISHEVWCLRFCSKFHLHM